MKLNVSFLPLGTKRMDPYWENKWGLFWLNDDQISLSDFTSLRFATAPGFSLSAGRPVGEGGPHLSAGTSQNAGSEVGGVGERKGSEEYCDFSTLVVFCGKSGGRKDRRRCFGIWQAQGVFGGWLRC